MTSPIRLREPSRLAFFGERQLPPALPISPLTCLTRQSREVKSAAAFEQLLDRLRVLTQAVNFDETLGSRLVVIASGIIGCEFLAVQTVIALPPDNDGF